MSVLNNYTDGLAELLYSMRYSDKTCLRYCDDLYSTTFNPWAGSAVNSGTYASVAASAKHPGVISCNSSTTANSGWLLMTNMTNNHIPFYGRMRTTFILKPVTLTGSMVRAGFHDGTTYTTPSHGAWLQIDQGVAKGAASTGAAVYTASSFTMTSGTWYRCVIDVDTFKGTVTYRVFQDDSNTVLWKDTITVDLTAWVVKHGVIATNSGTTVSNIVHIDLMEFFLYNTRKVF